jgi:hypothetical protein
MGMRSCRTAFRTYAQSNGSRDCDVTGGACVTVTTNRSSTCFNRRERVHQSLQPRKRGVGSILTVPPRPGY